MGIVTEAIPKHVPAWKKLGLKLKYAKDEPDINPTQAVAEIKSTNENHKRPSTPHEPEEALESLPKRPTKKLKTTATTTSTTKATKRSEADDEIVEHVIDQTSATPVSKSKTKSVSFTPETKDVDGDSLNQVHQAWLASQSDEDPLFNPKTLNLALKVITPPSTASTQRQNSDHLSSAQPSDTNQAPEKGKPKKKKKKKSKTTHAKPPPSEESRDSENEHPVLGYLQSHNENKSDWKFSKKLQSLLLKHIFDLSQIPSSYDIALLSYLRGLEGSSAKAKIRAEALEVRIKDEEWLSPKSEDTDPGSTSAQTGSTEAGVKSVEDTDMGLERQTTAQNLASRRRDYENEISRIKQLLRDREEAREIAAEDTALTQRLRQRRRAEVILRAIGEEATALERPKPQPSPQPQSSLNKHPTSYTRPDFRPPASHMPPSTSQAPYPGMRPDFQPKSSQPAKKIVFGETDSTATTTRPIPPAKTIPNNTQPQRAVPISQSTDTPKRKRRRKRTAKDRAAMIPDDETSSSSSSDSDSDGDEDDDGGKIRAKAKEAARQQLVQKKAELHRKRQELERARREVEESISGSSSSESSGDDPD